MAEYDWARMYWIKALLIPVGILLIYFWHEYGFFEKFGDIISFFIIFVILSIIYFISIFLFARETKNQK